MEGPAACGPFFCWRRLPAAISRKVEGTNAWGWMDEAMVEAAPLDRARAHGRGRYRHDGRAPRRRRRSIVDPDSSSSAATSCRRTGSPSSSAETVRQSELGPDGHPNKGIVLPPIPMPRRMGAGRRVKIMGRLRAGEPAVKKAEVADIVPKSGRSGDIFVLTMRHTIEQARQDHRGRRVRRDLPPRRAAGPEDDRDGRRPRRAPTTPGATPRQLTNTLNFRYGGAHLERPPHPL